MDFGKSDPKDGAPLETSAVSLGIRSETFLRTPARDLEYCDDKVALDNNMEGSQETTC